MNALTIGQHFATGFKARSYAQQVCHSQQLRSRGWSLQEQRQHDLLVCKCSGKRRNTHHLPAVIGTQGEVAVSTSSRSTKRPLSMPLESKATMVALVRDSSATLTQVAGMVNFTYGTHILGGDVYNRTYDHHEETRTSCAKYLESLQDGLVYRSHSNVNLARLQRVA
ncbi:hypothetical protein V1506DRAFT_569355 [Lipomyces tetrasporus]